MVNNTRAQDWAELNRYKVANERLLTRAEGEERVVFMGDSITEEWKKYNPGLFDNTEFINRGIGGQTTEQMKIRFWQDVIDLQPSTVVILGGINDIAQNHGFVPIKETVQNIIDMAELAKKQDIDVIICSVLPANYLTWRPSILPTHKVAELNGLLQKYANEHDCRYLDYYSEMVDKEKGMKALYTTDGVHCTNAGYQVMEDMITPLLNQ